MLNLWLAMLGTRHCASTTAGNTGHSMGCSLSTMSVYHALRATRSQQVITHRTITSVGLSRSVSSAMLHISSHNSRKATSILHATLGPCMHQPSALQTMMTALANSLQLTHAYLSGALPCHRQLLVLSHRGTVWLEQLYQR